MADEDMTLGEVGRRLATLTDTTSGLAEQVGELVSRDRADLLRFEHLGARVAALETIVSRLTWTVVTAVVGAVLAVVLKVV